MLVNVQESETEERLSRVRNRITGTFVEWDYLLTYYVLFWIRSL